MSKHTILFRITDAALPDGLFASLKDKGLRFMVKETGTETGKPHFQGIVECNKNSFRSLLKAYYHGNEEYSTKIIADGNVVKTVQYLCKGDGPDDEPDVRYNEGFNTTALHTAYWQVNAALHTVKKQKVDYCDDIVSYINDVAPTISSREITIIGGHICAWFIKEGRRMPSSFQMESILNTVIARLNKDSEVPLDMNNLFQMLYGNKLRL